MVLPPTPTLPHKGGGGKQGRLTDFSGSAKLTFSHTRHESGSPGEGREARMAEKYIFTIQNLTKAYNKKEVLKDIWLASYPGAKIGVIGGNGSGKSTLLRIMALADRDFLGSAEPDRGISIGFVPQEPRLDETTDVMGNLEQAVAPVRALLSKHEELGNQMAEADPDEMDALMEEMGKVQDQIEAVGAWDLDRT